MNQISALRTRRTKKTPMPMPTIDNVTLVGGGRVDAECESNSERTLIERAKGARHYWFYARID